MRKATRNYWLDVLMALLALVLAVSSFLLWVVFPRGYFPARAAWVAIHKWVGLALGIAVLVHVAFHWRWLVRMTRRQLERLLVRQEPRKRGNDGYGGWEDSTFRPVCGKIAPKRKERECPSAICGPAPGVWGWHAPSSFCSLLTSLAVAEPCRRLNR
jgi:hypothetical protein